MKKVIGILGLSLCFMMNAAAKTKIIAHRGYWDTEGSAQNSIASLKKASELKLYGAEFDVHVTKDGVVVLNHDETINGNDIQHSNYADIKDQKLSNGETIPTLEQYLDAAKSTKGLKLILEIKPHKSKEADERAVNAVMDIVKSKKAVKDTEYISFSLDICKAIIARDAKATVAYLRGDIAPQEAKQLGFSGLDYYFKTYEQHPEWIKEAQKLGLTINVWTVNDQAVMLNMIGQNVDFITTDNPVLLRKLIK